MTGEKSGLVIVWEFYPQEGLELEFEEAYGPRGTWVKFFKKGEGYAGTSLHRDIQEPRRYITIDEWQSESAYDNFRQKHLAEYQRIDDQCKRLTSRELLIGSFVRQV